MGSSLMAICMSCAAPPSLDVLRRQLESYLRAGRGASVVVDDALPPFKPRQIRVTWTEDDAGEPNPWYCTLQFEEGDGVAAENRAAAEQAAGRPDRDLIGAARARVRASFPDDPRRLFSSKFLQVVEFLVSLPGVAVFDARRGDFISSAGDQPVAPPRSR